MKICGLPSSKHVLDFGKALALGFRHYEQYEEKGGNTTHAEDPESY